MQSRDGVFGGEPGTGILGVHKTVGNNVLRWYLAAGLLRGRSLFDGEAARMTL